MKPMEVNLTPWKKYERQGNPTKPEEEFLPLPEKPRNVIEFEGLKREGKEKIRESSEGTEIARYYDRIQEVLQHNISVHAYRMRIGLEPIGRVQYIENNFVYPIHKE